jgi:hypothetical protein
MASIRGPAGNPPGVLGTLSGQPASPQPPAGMSSPYDAILRQFASMGFPAAGGSSSLNPGGMVQDPIMADQLASPMPPSESARRLDPGLLDPAGPFSPPPSGPGGPGAGVSLAQQLQTGTPAGVGSLPGMLAQGGPPSGPPLAPPGMQGPPQAPPGMAPGGMPPGVGGPPGLGALQQLLLAQQARQGQQMPAASSPLLNALGGGGR